MQTVKQAFQKENIHCYPPFLNKFGDEFLGKLSGKMTSFTLEKNMSDTEILQKIQNRYSTFADILQTIKEEKGLLNNGYTNIFYVSAVLVVNVFWDSDYRKWHVGDWRLGGDGKWHAGIQVLCPGNANTMTTKQEVEEFISQLKMEADACGDIDSSCSGVNMRAEADRLQTLLNRGIMPTKESMWLLRNNKQGFNRLFFF